MNLGENIYHYRSQKNMSQGDLADALEVSRQSVSKWENNSAVPELEKLLKMAQVFGITLDELVTGEAKEEPAPQPMQPTPSPAPEVREGLSGRKIVGSVLLTLGLLLSLVCFVLTIVLGNRYEEDLLLVILLIGIPVTALGLCCLLVKKHTALACGWIVYLVGYAYITIFSGGISIILPMTTGSVVSIVLLSFGTALSAVTLVKLWKGQITQSLPLKILVTLLIVAMLIISVWLMLPVHMQTITPVQWPA